MADSGERDAPRYLRVNFGDNDFGIPIQKAVVRLWENLRENNEDNFQPPRTLAIAFQQLHEAGALVSMIARAVDAEYHYMDVEFATRGLYWDKVDWKEKKVTKAFKSITDTYLPTDLSFHDELSDEWANGEEAWLELETGKVVMR